LCVRAHISQTYIPNQSVDIRHKMPGGKTKKALVSYVNVQKYLNVASIKKSSEFYDTNMSDNGCIQLLFGHFQLLAVSAILELTGYFAMFAACFDIRKISFSTWTIRFGILTRMPKKH